MPEDLKFIASATGFDKVEAGLKNVSKGLAETAVQATKVDSALARGVKGTNQAAFALQNLGRIAQDAPFGIIGITNNINPLLESFQRLKAESGSTGIAIKALASSFLGAGGLGFVVSIASALLTVFALNNRSAGSAVKEHKKEVDEATKSEEAYQRALESVSSKLVKQAKDYTDLKALLIETTGAIKDITEATINQGLAEFIFSKKSEALTKLLQSEVDKRLKVLKSIKVPEFIVPVKIKTGTGSTAGLVPAFDKTISDISKGLPEFNKLNKAIGDSKKELTDLNAIAEELGLKSIFERLVNGSEKAKRTIQDVLDELRRGLSVVDTEQSLFGINPDDFKKKIGLIESAIKELAVKFKLDPKDTLIQKLFGDINTVRIEETIQVLLPKLIKTIKAGLANDPITVPFETDPVVLNKNLNDFTDAVKAGLILRLNALHIPFNPFDNVEGLQKQLDDAQRRIDDFKKRVEISIRDLKVNIATALGEGLGNAIVNIGKSGKDIGGAFFAPLLEALGNGLKEFGKQALVANIAIQTIKKTFGKALGIPGAIAAIALGTIISALANKLRVPAFAGGVTNFAGGAALVGERGPELVTLPRGSNVIPNNQLGNVSGGQPILVFAESRLSGTDIYFSFKQTSERIGRST